MVSLKRNLGTRLAGTEIRVCFPVEWAAHTPAAGIFGSPLARHERDVSSAKGQSRGASGSSFRHANLIEPLSLFLIYCQSAAAAPAGCCFIIASIPFFISFAVGSALCVPTIHA